MNELIEKHAPHLISALLIEDIISHRTRRKILKTLFVFTLICLAFYLFSEDNFSHGIFLFVLGLTLFFGAIEAFYYSSFSRSFEDKNYFSFPLAEILLNSGSGDVIRGFFFSDLGDEVAIRLGISEDSIIEYLKTRTKDGSELINVTITNENFINELVNIPSLKRFLVRSGITAEEFKGCFYWVISMYVENIERERFWSEENLSRIPSIGKDWAFKKTYELEKIAHNLSEKKLSHLQGFRMLYSQSLKKLERALSKEKGSNAILVCENDEEGVDIANLLAEKIRSGKIYPLLKHKKVFLIEPEIIIENSANGKDSQSMLFNALVEAVDVKNAIVVFPRFLSFVKSQNAIGADIISSIKPFLDSKNVNLVFIDDVNTFDEGQIEYLNISHYAEIVKVEIASEEAGLAMLQNEAENLEIANEVCITFPAILTAHQEAKRNYTNHTALDESRNILIETVPYVIQLGRRIILKEDVLKVVEEKTGIPNSIPNDIEKIKLLDLEKILHKRIIGQEEAIKSISSALRRSRAGISSKDRPIGSFLFLGPTGVGKTETAKALAEVMFGSDKKMSRIDMSEYQGSDSLPRLIGSFGNQKQGSLSNLLRDNPYGVVLLDEFEKATSEIHNLFLQVLDEGFFTDNEAKRVNARTSMFIATSNAGSDVIWDIVKSGNDLYESKDKIIDEIIKQKIFAPELINRFDGVILFHPLQEKELRQVATLMLNSLNKRLEEKSISFEITPELLDFLIKKGTDPKFGARPMRRAIEEDVEEKIASGIISGDLKPGMIASFETDNGSVKLKV
ncbi:MAG: AAA family ATPase [bacterium]